MKFSVTFVSVLFALGIAAPVVADLNLLNGAVIRFTDNSTISTAPATGPHTAAPPPGHGGLSNTVSGSNSFLGGGRNNTANAAYSSVSGGYKNTATEYGAAVGGGFVNEATGRASTIAGGYDNAASDYGAAIGGGRSNTASGRDSTVGGGRNNTAGGYYSAIGGGISNLVTDDYGTIGGGTANQAGDNADPRTDRRDATVGGGRENTASGAFSTVGGGGGILKGNTASGTYSTVGGGFENEATGKASLVGGGFDNLASGDYSTVAGGRSNTASGNTSTVGGGRLNVASGHYSFAAGKTANDGGFDNVFVWDDGSGSAATVEKTFNVNALNGIYFNGGAVHTSSDRNLKEAFSFVSARDVLDKVVDMPVTTWRFKSEEDSVRHIGPMAQDFMAAFGYGTSDKHIAATDASGVALASIQALYEVQQEKDAKARQQAQVNTALRWQNAMLASRNDSLEARIVRLEKAILPE